MKFQSVLSAGAETRAPHAITEPPSKQAHSGVRSREPYATRLAEITPIREAPKNGKEIEDSIAAPAFLYNHYIPDAQILIQFNPNDLAPHPDHKKEIRESPSPE